MAWKSHRYYIIYLRSNDNITSNTRLCECNLIHQSVACGIDRLKRYICVDIPSDMKLYKKYKWEDFYKTKSRKKIKSIPYWVYEKVYSGLPDFKVIETNSKNN